MGLREELPGLFVAFMETSQLVRILYRMTFLFIRKGPWRPLLPTSHIAAEVAEAQAS